MLLTLAFASAPDLKSLTLPRIITAEWYDIKGRAVDKYVAELDVTMSGMGRGAGNCYSELLMGFLRNPKYRISPVLKFVEKHMVPLKKAGVVWGCDVQYMITGNANHQQY